MVEQLSLRVNASQAGIYPIRARLVNEKGRTRVAYHFRYPTVEIRNGRRLITIHPGDIYSTPPSRGYGTKLLKRIIPVFERLAFDEKTRVAHRPDLMWIDSEGLFAKFGYNFRGRVYVGRRRRLDEEQKKLLALFRGNVGRTHTVP